MGLPSLITILGAVGCAAKPYAALLAEVNACANRADPPNTSLHVWTGARGHPEIGNLFVVLVHATLAALALGAVVGLPSRNGARPPKTSGLSPWR